MSASFIVSYAIALRLYDLRVFEHSDVWFNADPNGYYRLFSRSPVADPRHPTVSPMVFGAVALWSGALKSFGLTSGSTIELRTWLALLAAPAAAALRSLLLFGVFHRLTGRLWLASMLAVTDIASFASVTLGSVPETYGFSALCIAAMCWLSIEDAVGPAWVRAVQWIVVGAVAIGVTITNILPLVVLLVTTLLRRNPGTGRAVLNTAVLSITASLLVGVFALTVASRHRNPDYDERALQITGSVLHPINMPDVRELTWSVGHTLIAPTPRLEPGWPGRLANPDFDFIVSYRSPYQHGIASFWRWATTLTLVLLGVIGFARRGELFPLPMAALGVLGANLLMHLFWGDHYYVYALHWQAGLLVLIAGIGRFEPRANVIGEPLLAGLAVATVTNSLVQLRDLLAYLANA